MAQIGTCWAQTSWVVSGGWAANTWAAVSAAVNAVAQRMGLDIGLTLSRGG